MSENSHISARSHVKKSAFSPIRPSFRPPVAEAKGQQENSPPKENKPPAKAVVLPTQVELYAEPVSRTDRTVFGWSYIAKRSASIPVVCIVINLEHWLIKRALLTQDAALIAYALGLTLGECLTYRARTTPWLPALLDKLREAMFKGQDDLKKLNGVQFLGGQLAQAQAFKTVSNDLLASGGHEPGKKHWVATIRLGEEEGRI